MKLQQSRKKEREGRERIKRRKKREREGKGGRCNCTVEEGGEGGGREVKDVQRGTRVLYRKGI